MAIIKPEQLSSGTYSISGSFSGSFHGDGSDLNNLPSNVISTGSYADFPSTGSEGYIYIDNSANIGYLWDSGSIPPTYVNIAGPSTPPDVIPLAFANAATVLTLSPSPLYNNGVSGSGAVLTGSINGALSDGTNPGKIDYTYTPVVGDVILVKNQLVSTNPTLNKAFQNGLYTITSTGSASSKYVLTRTGEYDVSSELYPLQVNVLTGTNNAARSFIQSTVNPVIGTSNLIFAASSTATSVAAQIAFVDTVIDTPLTNIIYATGSIYALIPGAGATLTSTVSGSLGTWNGLSVNTNQNITGSFTKALVINQTNPAYNGDYSVLATGSNTVFWKLQRINNSSGGFNRYTRFFLVSNTSSSKAGRMYFTAPNSPALTDATIGTAPINIFEYGGGTSTSAFPFTGSALITGSLGVTGSVSSTQGFTGSLLGTASLASTASFVVTAQTASYVLNAVSSSFATTASYALNALSASWAPSVSPFPFTGSALITGSLGVTGSVSVIGSSSIDLVRITQTGTGNAFVVEDSTTPDVSPFVIDNMGRVGIGKTIPSAPLDITGSVLVTGSVSILAFTSSAANIFTIRNNANTNNIISLSGDGRFTIGLGSTTAASTAVAIGINSTAGTISSIAIGGYVTVDAASDSSTAVGYGSSITSTGYRGVALGFTNTVAAGQGIAIGERSSISAGGTNGIAIGSAAGVSAASSFMAGPGVTNSVANSNAFANGLNGFSFFNDVNSNHVINSAVIPVNNVSYLNTTKNVLYLGTAVKPETTIKNGVQSYTNYRTISAATVTPGSTATGVANLKTLTFSAGTNMSALTVGTRIIVTNNIGEQTHANIVSVVGLVVTIDSAMVNINVSTLNATATSVANSTIVIISDFHQEIRNDKGDIVKLYTQPAVTSSQGIADALTNLGLLTGSSVIVTTPTSGPFGISNSSGSYTYYTSFSASMAASISGQTIEVFADITESSAVTITCKDNVKINGNGHTYKCTSNGVNLQLFTNASGANCFINNLTIEHTSSHSNSATIYLSNGSFDLTGTIIKKDAGYCAQLGGGKLYNGIYIGTSSTVGIINQGGEVFSSIISCVNGAGLNNISGNSYNITSITTGTGSAISGSNIFKGIGIAYGNAYGASLSGNCHNIEGFSAAAVGVYLGSGNYSNITGISNGNFGVQNQGSNCIVSNLRAISTVSNGFFTQSVTGVVINGGLIQSSAAITISSNSELSLNNVYIKNTWNTAGAHGLLTATDTVEVINCIFDLTNTSANCLTSSTPKIIKYANCSFKGSTTPVNANITQGMINTHDNQGNIII
jgi:hypothetical protein